MSGTSRNEDRTKAGWLVPAGLLALGIVPAIGGAPPRRRRSGATVTPENALFFAAPKLVEM